MKCQARILTAAMLLPALLGIGQPVHAQSASDQNMIDWDQKSMYADVSISTKLKTIDEAEWRETTASLIIDVPMSNVLWILGGNSDILGSLKRMKEVQDFNVSVDKTSWYSYLVFDMPWPMKEQDIVIRCTQIREEDSGNVRIEMRSVKDLIPRKEGIVRMKNFKGVWVLKAVYVDKTEVEYIACASSKGLLPRWITDPIVHKNLRVLMESLRDLSSSTLALNEEK